MSEEVKRRIRISVRQLVEFVFRSGDIDNRMGAGRDKDAMLLGAQLHRKIQRQQGPGYQAEVSLKQTYCLNDYLEEGMINPEEPLYLVLEGRADGVFTEEDTVIVDEIKGVYMDLTHLKESNLVHRAQALCYAYMLAKERGLSCIGVQVTYCQMESEEVRRFREMLSFEELEAWFRALLQEYGKWARYTWERRVLRLETTKGMEFPFSYRPGQRDLAVSVYRSVRRGRNLFIQAPTGIGKTMSVLFPAIKAMGEGTGEKLFYLTAKNVTREAAEEALRILREKGLRFTSTAVTAKEKSCMLEKPECNPESCPYAKGHFDRVNDAVYGLLQDYEAIGREEIRQAAEKHRVCPFELGLDVTDWVDGIICDYNYAFDPNVALRRYFAEGIKGEYLFLVDEAHNLVERAREMYSAVLIKEDFLAVKKLVKPHSKKLEKRLEQCNKQMLELKRECDAWMIYPDVNALYLAVLGAFGEMENFRADHPGLDLGEEYRDLYFKLRHFINMYDRSAKGYCGYGEHLADGAFAIKLFCVHPALNLRACLEKSVATVFFSATLLPVHYYKELLGGEPDDYAVYAPSPFASENRMLAVCTDVSSRYTRRNEAEYRRIADEIARMVEGKKGHYMAFFPSYAYLEQVGTLLKEQLPDVRMLTQTTNMREADREAFLAEFRENLDTSLLGLCVLGGVFSEGIDLAGDCLIGAAVVGTGLPQVCAEREILKNYFEEQGKDGFAYAYRYPGFNKVMQAAGRVIRTDADQGVILLMDDRFLQWETRQLFPREWEDVCALDGKTLAQYLNKFWNLKHEGE